MLRLDSEPRKSKSWINTESLFLGRGRELCFVKFISPHATEIITELFQGDVVSLPALMSSRFPLLHFASRCRER